MILYSDEEKKHECIAQNVEAILEGIVLTIFTRLLANYDRENQARDL